MPIDHLDADEVMALRFDEVGAAEDLAAWCNGEVSHPVDHPELVVILVPSVEAAKPAHLGDWIVRESDGTHRVYGPEAFAARFEPAG